jgi:phage replication-related protein YjqB (UPF0714/DUF867 family)
MDDHIIAPSSDSESTLDRRTFLRMIGIASLPLAASGCDTDTDDASLDSVDFREANAPADVDISVVQAKSSQSINSKQEHLSIDSNLTSYLALGDQCRVVLDNGNLALYTVGEVRNEPGNNRVRMGWEARARLATTQTFAATLRTTVVAPSSLSDSEVQAQSEFVERLVDDDESTGLIAIAPHGGFIEKHTDEQAAHVQWLLAGKGACSWICKGYKQGGGAWDRWHITSTDISRHSFPGLDQVAQRKFTYAVSFHGMSYDVVLIGGGAPYWLKQLIHAAIAKVLAGSGIDVAIATADDVYSGDSAKNVVNWLTVGGLGGVQIEQSMRARATYGLAIAAAVADVFGDLLDDLLI